MSIIIIDEQVQEWKEVAEKEADQYFAEIVGYLTEFKNLSNLNAYIWHDAEDYFEPEAYEKLLSEISDLTQPVFVISEIKSKDWTFTFKLNGKDETIEMGDPDTDWLQDSFIDELNNILTRHGADKKLRMVDATSENNIDQTFNLCFIATLFLQN